MRPLLASILVVLAAVACRPDPPEPELSPALASLRSSTYDPRHGLEYWTRSLDRRGTDSEWDAAVAYCAQHGPDEHPNCRTIELLSLAARIPGFGTREVLP